MFSTSPNKKLYLSFLFTALIVYLCTVPLLLFVNQTAYKHAFISQFSSVLSAYQQLLSNTEDEDKRQDILNQLTDNPFVTSALITTSKNVLIQKSDETTVSNWPNCENSSMYCKISNGYVFSDALSTKDNKTPIEKLKFSVSFDSDYQLYTLQFKLAALLLLGMLLILVTLLNRLLPE